MTVAGRPIAARYVFGVTELLERGAELAALADAVARAVAGDGGVALIEGPAGIGKTCLLSACEREGGAAGMRVLDARGDPVTMGSPFAAARELLAPAHTAPLEGPARLAAPVFAEAEAEPEGGDRLASVMHGLHWLVADLAEQAPLLICIDDAHWLDVASARFAASLGRRARSMAVLVVLARRSGEGADASGLAEIADPFLRLRALSPDAAETVVRARLGPLADRELSRACHHATNGNPFYLRELLDALALEPDGPSAAAALRSGSIAGGAIGRTVLVRLARLGGDCEQLAQAASILAPGSPLRHAATLAGLDRERAAAAADRLRSADLLAPPVELSFVHPLVREAVAGELLPSRRGELHAAAAEMLAEEGAAPDVVAAHLMSAEPYAEGWVVEALRRAARGALRQGAPDVAVPYLRRALAEPPAPGERLGVLIELGDAEAKLPVAQEHAALREALELATDPEQRAEIALKLALALFGAIRSDEGRRVIEGVLDAEPRLPQRAAAELEQALIGGGIVDLGGARSVLARALPLLERAERGEVSEPRMLTALAMAGAAAGIPSDRVTAMARQALADERLFTQWLDDGYVTATVALTWADQLEESAAAQEAGIAEARRHGWSSMWMQLEALRAETALRAGDLRLAEEHGQPARELASELGAAEFASLPLAGAALERGDAAQALALLEQGGRETATWPAVAALALRGRAHAAAGAPERGVTEMLDAAGRMAYAGLQLSVIVDWASDASRALAGLGRLDEALELADRELAEARVFGAPRRLGAALTMRGSLEPREGGLSMLAEAVSALEGSGARLEHARALIGLGTAMLRTGERERARAPLSLGLDIAHRCGGAVLASRARQELVASGARPRREALSGIDALTPAESRTARLAAGGLTNRAIAQTLFLSTKTVEKQLSQAYLKLGIAGRRELAEALAGQSVGVAPQKE